MGRALVALAMLAGRSPRPMAQDASVTGTVLDASKAVVPGVTVTATNVATGVPAVTVSDENGRYRLQNLPPGTYKLQAELTGFSTVVIPVVELRVGQNATVPFELKLADLNETITVTGEAPFVDVSSSQVTGNVNPRQMEALPLQGRNWMELSKMVKGMTANEVSINPGVSDDMFQLNLDGQQVTQKISGGFGQPRFSREAIAEFQIITNMFDITQGRSAGLQVQAISRSGTNDLSGSFYGFFRDDQLNAKDADHRHGAAVREPAGRRLARRADHPQQAALLRLVRVRARARARASRRRRRCPGRASRCRSRTRSGASSAAPTTS